MADNSTLPATGDVIASDDVSGVKYQYVKLADGTADSSAKIGGDATNGLDVDVTRVQGTVTVDSELTTADLDTGAGTDTRAVVGLVGSKSGGGALIPGDATAGLKVDLGADNDVTVTNATAANLKAEVTGATSGSGTATGAIRVELPTNGTGVVGLNAGTNAIGKLAANSGVDIGDVDVTTVGTITPGTAATSLGKAEDVGHSTGDTGVAVWAVRRSDANAVVSTAGSDDDYTAFQTDSRGTLQVVARPYPLRIQGTSAGLTTASTAYAIGDQAGTLISFSNAAKYSGGGGLIQNIHMLDEGDVGVSYRLHFYVASVSLASDNAAFAVSDADQRNKVASILMPDMADMGANRECTLTGLGLHYTCSSTTLYCAVETRTANAVYAAVGDLKITLEGVFD